MTNSISSRVPYAGYPYNATGATPVTKDIASYCYDTQRPYIQKTTNFLTTEDKTSYKWPLIGAIVSALSLIAVTAIKRKP